MNNITQIKVSSTVEITSGAVTSAFVEDANGRRAVPEDIGKFQFFVTVVEHDGGRICMWSGDTYAEARAEAGECAQSFDGRIHDLTGREV
jgi:hypothetical protein